MEEELIELSKYRLEKAHDDLIGAKLLFENGLYAQSLNRSYYSIFHSVRALFVYERFDSKKHSGIISHFNQFYVKTGKLDKKYSEIIMTAEHIRHNSDYDDFYIADKEQANIQIQHAELFLKMIHEFIAQNFK